MALSYTLEKSLSILNFEILLKGSLCSEQLAALGKGQFENQLIILVLKKKRKKYWNKLINNWIIFSIKSKIDPAQFAHEVVRFQSK